MKTVRYQVCFDKNDNLVSQTDGNGNTTTYQYDELDRKIGETSPLKETNEYRYDAIGNLTKSKDDGTHYRKHNMTA